jgi:O-antigen/teichoic acid export membrane protein
MTNGGGTRPPALDAEEPPRAQAVRSVLRRVAGASSLAAALERVLNRGASGLVSVVMLFFVTPSEMGFYAAVYLVFTLAQSSGDSAVRQSAAPLWYTTGGRATLRRATWVSGSITTCATALFAVGALLLTDVSTTDAVMALALASAGAFSAAALPRVTFQEAIGAWRTLARRQAVASGVSIVVGVALVPSLGVGGGFAQTIVAEGMFLLLIPPPQPDRIAVSGDGHREARQIFSLAGTNVLGWIQGQAERVTIGLFGGPAALGRYTVAYQMARTVADPAATGLSAWLRNWLARPDVDVGVAFRSGIRRALLFGTALQGAVMVVVILPLSLVLPATWGVSLHMAIVLSVSLPIVLAHWCMSALLIIQGRAHEMLRWQLLGVALTIGCGFLVTVSVWVGVSALVARDVAMLGARTWLTRAYVDRRLTELWLGCMAVTCSVAAVGWLLTDLLRPLSLHGV